MLFTDDEERQEEVDDILSELDKCDVEKSGKEEKWDRWRRQREGVPETEAKNYPFENASNVCVPLTVSNQNTVFAQAKNMFGVINPFWTASALQQNNSADIKIAEVLTRYFDILCDSPTDLNKKEKDKTILYESTSLGTCYVKIPWLRREWKISMESGEGLPVELPVIAHNGPSLEPIPLEDIFCREAYQDIQTAPLFAHRLHKTWHELKLLEEQGFYENVDEIERYFRDLPLDSTRKQEEREDVSSIEARMWDIYECYKFVEFEGSWRDCIITIERESGVVLREGYNELGVRPFENFVYLHRPYRREGIGVCQLCDHMQEEVNMLHNTRTDAVHIGVAPMLVIRKNAGYRTNEKVYPGKIWFLDDPSRDITPIKLPEPYNQSLQAEQMSMTYAQRASGMSDAMSGFADAMVKSRDSPGLMSMRVKQGSGVFGAVAEGLENSYSNVANFIYYQLIRHREEVIAMERVAKRLSEEDIATLEEALSIAPNEVPLRIRFTVHTSDVEQTFEAKRQNLLTLNQLYSVFFQQTFPIAQQLFGPMGMQMQKMSPQLYEYLLRIYLGQCRMMDKTLTFFGQEDTAKYVPEYKKLEQQYEMQKLLQEMMQQMMQMQQMQGGGGALPAQGGMNAQRQIAGGNPAGFNPATGAGTSAPAGGSGAPPELQGSAGSAPEPSVGGVF